MKKFLIIVTIICLILFSFPFIGNKVVESALNDRVVLLESYGVQLETFQSDKTYLKTKNHYKFIIKDSDKFMLYLSTITNTQFDPSLKNTLSEASFATDLSYNNFPLSDVVSADIYLLAFSKNYMSKIKEKELKFYAYVKRFLKDKGLLGHIKYNMLNNDFDGYIKDINEHYVFDDNSTFTCTLLKSNYNGRGVLFSPDYFVSNTQLFNVEIKNPEEYLHFKAVDFQSTTSFDTQNTYISSFNAYKIDLSVEDSLNNDLNFSMSGFNLNLSSDMQGKKAQIYLKNGFDNMYLKTQNNNIQFVDFDYEVSIENINKTAYKKFQELVSQANPKNTQEIDAKVMESLLHLLSQGIKLNVANFSMRNLIQDTTQKLGGFKMKLLFDLQKDKDFAFKLYNTPMELQKDISLDFDLKIDKTLFMLAEEEFPILKAFGIYFQELGEILSLRLKTENTHLSINGKRLH